MRPLATREGDREADARRLVNVLARRVRTSAKRNCLAAGDRRDALLAEAKELQARAKAVQKSPYCAAQ